MVEYRENDLALSTSYQAMESYIIAFFEINEPVTFSVWDAPIARILLLFAKKQVYEDKTVFPERFAIGRTAKEPEKQKEFNVLLKTYISFSVVAVGKWHYDYGIYG